MRSLDLKWAFWTLAVAAMLFFWMGRASADEVDDAIRRQYIMEYNIAKGRAGYACRRDKYYACWKLAYDKASRWDKFLGTIKDDCPDVHSKEMYESCKDEIDSRFPDLQEDSK